MFDDGDHTVSVYTGLMSDDSDHTVSNRLPHVTWMCRACCPSQTPPSPGTVSPSASRPAPAPPSLSVRTLYPLFVSWPLPAQTTTTLAASPTPSTPPLRRAEISYRQIQASISLRRSSIHSLCFGGISFFFFLVIFLAPQYAKLFFLQATSISHGSFSCWLLGHLTTGMFTIDICRCVCEGFARASLTVCVTPSEAGPSRGWWGGSSRASIIRPWVGRTGSFSRWKHLMNLDNLSLLGQSEMS